MPNPSQHQANKSQFAYDASQWAVSKSIDLAAKYQQKNLNKLVTVSLINISQALGNPSQQMTIFSVSLRPSWKASIGVNM